MNLSGLLLTALPEDLDDICDRVRALPGMHLGLVDRTRGCVVVVQEAASIADEMRGFQTLAALPGVVSVRLGAHYFGEEQAAMAA